MAGARSMASMKHVGVNVAADPMMTFATMRVNGGSVLVTADEPGMFSSQNEQDNRNFAKMAKMPMFEPADSQECLDMMKEAYEVSETYGALVLMRMVTRVCHSKSLVEVGERVEVANRPWEKDLARFVCVPANARVNRVNMEERTKKLEAYSEQSKFNFAEMNGTKIGVIASGPSYYYAKEVFGEDASYLKLGFTFPLPTEMIKEFCSKVETIYIVEEDDPYIEEFVQRLGFACHGKDTFPA